MATIFTNIKDRVLQLAENKGVNKEIFFKELDVTYGNFKGKAKDKALSSDTLAKIVSKYPDVNSDWLLTGNGNMYRDGYVYDIPASVLNDSGQLVNTPIKSKVRGRRLKDGLINFYDVEFAAGDINFYDDNYTIKPAYTMDIPEFNGCTAFRAYGNSMEKLIKSGDILFATKEDDWQDGIEYGQIYGIVCNNKRKYLKYLRKAPGKDDTHFLLKSENAEDFDDFLLEKSKIKSIWLIHGWLKKRVG